MDDAPTAPDEDQDQPIAEADAPDTGQAETDAGEAEVNLDDFDLAQVPESADRDWFETRYKDLRADYTRKTQALAEQRTQVQTVIEAAQNPNHAQHQEALEYLGLELAEEDDTEDEYDDDPLAPIQQEIAALKQAEQQRAEMLNAQQAETQLEDYLEGEITDLQRAEGIDEFSEAELRILVNAAVSSPDQRGNPDVRGAYAALQEAYGSRQKAWLSSKKAPRAPGAGVPGSAELDITDRSARLDEATRIAEAAMGD